MKVETGLLIVSLLLSGCGESEEPLEESPENRAARFDAIMTAYQMPKTVALELKYGVDQEVVRAVMALNSYQSQMDIFQRAVAATNGFPQELHDELLNGLRSVSVSNDVSEKIVGAIYYDLKIYEIADSK